MPLATTFRKIHPKILDTKIRPRIQFGQPVAQSAIDVGDSRLLPMTNGKPEVATAAIGTRGVASTRDTP
jgi:hypothetical protein